MLGPLRALLEALDQLTEKKKGNISEADARILKKWDQDKNEELAGFNSKPP